MSTTLLTLLAVLCPLTTPVGHGDWHAPTPCRHCGLPALDHDVLAGGLLCPRVTGGKGESFVPGESTQRKGRAEE